jgi:hypothetical protein
LIDSDERVMACFGLRNVVGEPTGFIAELGLLGRDLYRTGRIARRYAGERFKFAFDRTQSRGGNITCGNRGFEPLNFGNDDRDELHHVGRQSTTSKRFRCVVNLSGFDEFADSRPVDFIRFIGT